MINTSFTTKPKSLVMRLFFVSDALNAAACSSASGDDLLLSCIRFQQVSPNPRLTIFFVSFSPASPSQRKLSLLNLKPLLLSLDVLNETSQFGEAWCRICHFSGTTRSGERCVCPFLAEELDCSCSTALDSRHSQQSSTAPSNALSASTHFVLTGVVLCNSCAIDLLLQHFSSWLLTAVEALMNSSFSPAPVNIASCSGFLHFS